MQIFKILLNWLCHQGNPKQYDKLVTICLINACDTFCGPHFISKLFVCMCVNSETPIEAFLFRKVICELFRSWRVGHLLVDWRCPGGGSTKIASGDDDDDDEFLRWWWYIYIYVMVKTTVPTPDQTRPDRQTLHRGVSVCRSLKISPKWINWN